MVITSVLMDGVWTRIPGASKTVRGALAETLHELDYAHVWPRVDGIRIVRRGKRAKRPEAAARSVVQPA